MLSHRTNRALCRLKMKSRYPRCPKAVNSHKRFAFFFLNISPQVGEMIIEVVTNIPITFIFIYFVFFLTNVSARTWKNSFLYVVYASNAVFKDWIFLGLSDVDKPM